MTTAKEIGVKLVGFCKEGKNEAAIRELYADDVVSVEAGAPPQGEREMRGKEAVLGKTQWWTDNHEVHGGTVEGPFPHGDDRFAVRFQYDVTFKPASRRMTMDEVAVYTVEDGKITREEFFYDMG
jgi:ketosteroid isomerase-like protein